MLTPEENYRIKGVVPREQMVQLLDDAARLESIEDIEGDLSEAKGCYPDEDFLHMEIAELREWAKRLRGENKDDFLELIDRIEGSRDAQNQTAEHGAELITRALKAIE